MLLKIFLTVVVLIVFLLLIHGVYETELKKDDILEKKAIMYKKYMDIMDTVGGILIVSTFVLGIALIWVSDIGLW